MTQQSIGAQLAAKRWEKATKAERLAVGKMLAEARRKKRKRQGRKA